MAAKASCWVWRHLEERSALCGRLCLRWKDLTTVQATKIQERSRRCLIWLKHSGVFAFQLHWLGQRFSTFPRKILRVLCGYFEHQRRVQCEGCVVEPLQTITAILLGSTWCRFLLVVFVARRVGRSDEGVFAFLRLKVSWKGGTMAWQALRRRF